MPSAKKLKGPIKMKFVIKMCCWILLILYLLVLYKYLVLDRAYYPAHRSFNLIPFDSIKQYINNKDDYNFNTWFMNLMGNFMMLMPLGVLLPVLHKRFRKFKNFIVFLIGINLTIETFQYYSGYGSLDIDDVIMNSSGGIVVYMIIKAILNIQLLNRILIKEYEIKQDV
ncbi:VanZ family protein [Paenibacillus wynnii]|uniref:VanZ family protein n=1 Tax=Paenibacillus wynnii TaxID=268407 RepID=UPI00068B53B6